ncbi:ATP-binding protein [Pseudochryseolinea flava]|uniref:Sensory/regulatory protein RpfC n=1 Tax=Pseudochryseolinea flava TaxID=2059302 RepID=A0A364XXJ4_9BACT|nr:ATP-binding protein [Pseudochryseolinea flava]RAV98718.1 hypothetical protein DQQ10_22135 [Pseudochryseolinea flava]
MTRAKQVPRLLIVSVVLSILTGIAIYKGFEEKREAQTWIDHTNNVIDTTIKLLAMLKETETTQRGYLITKDTAYLHAYSVAVKHLRESVNSLRDLTVDNEQQTYLLDKKIKPIIEDRIGEINQTIMRAQNSNFKFQESIVDFARGISKLDTLQGNITLMIRREQDLLKERTAHLKSASNFTERMIYASLTLVTLISILAFITILRVNKRNITLFNSLQDLNKNLETRVAQQTMAIKKANQDLHTRNDDLTALNEELQASEEELKSSLDQLLEVKNRLEENERLYRLVSENSQDFIALYLPDGTYTYVSPSVQTILGYEPSEILGTTGIGIIHPDDEASIRGARQHALNGKTLLNIRFRLRKKDGDYVWVESYTKPIIDDTGKVVSIQTSARDISVQKDFETQLINAKEQAEAATKAKSQFLSTMSHEIRTPMNAVIGLTHLLLQNDPRKDQVDNLNLLKFSGENLLTIINDILDFSKIEAEKLSLENIHFNLHDLVSTIVNINITKARDKGIRLDFDIDNNTPTVVQGDPVRLNQIITNLLSNAIKFTNYGSVKLIVNAEVHEKSFKVHFIIKDTGVGIPKEKLLTIFESFSQANNEITRKFGGTGLGLTISKRLADMMGGHIAVESIVNKGSVFTFSLVMEEGRFEETQHTKTSITSPSIGQRKILLVEDNHVNQVVATSFLTNWNIAVDCVDNGALAVAKIRSKAYDLVLMDLEMPEMDGYTATMTIRKMPETYFQSIPILALTASAMSEVRDRALSSGMTDLLTKPFNPAELYEKIRSLITIGDRDETDTKDLSTKLDLYADGNIEFKRELAGLIVENLKELQGAIHFIGKTDNLDDLKRAVHKVKTSLAILGDDALTDLVETIREKALAGDHSDLIAMTQRYDVITNKTTEQLFRAMRQTT